MNTAHFARPLENLFKDLERRGWMVLDCPNSDPDPKKNNETLPIGREKEFFQILHRPLGYIELVGRKNTKFINNTAIHR